MARLSIIIPVLNEARGIGSALERLDALREQGIEVIVVDGGSRDDTVARVVNRGVRCLRTRPGRAVQMNAGARAARGSMLAFLHADTVASNGALDRLARIADDPEPCWGRFDVRIDDERLVFRLIGWAMNLRSRLTRIATGDQLIFVHRELFHSAGGYPCIALMEDVALCKTLRRLAAPRCCRETVHTSARRWRRRGTLRTVCLMWWLRLRFVLGADPRCLARAYRVTETDGSAGH